MEKNIFNIIMLASALMSALMFTSCSDMDEKSASLNMSSNALKFDISDGVQSKAVTNGFATSFRVGDEAGVFGVKPDGTLAYDNLLVTFNEDGFWTPSTEIELTEELKSITFYSYYPYNDDAVFDAKSANPFGKYISTYNNGANIADSAAYEQADLMTTHAGVKSTESGSVSMTLNHDMALLCIELPAEGYKFTNTDQRVLPYLLKKDTLKTVTLGNETIVPFYDEVLNQYRLIINPNMQSGNLDVKFKANGATSESSVTIKNVENLPVGTYTTKTVNGGSKWTPWNLQVGDYYMKDGTLSTSPASNDDVLGVVCHIMNQQDIDTLTLYGPTWKHAMVLSKNAEAYSSQKSWGQTSAYPTLPKSPVNLRLFYQWYGLNHISNGSAQVTTASAITDEMVAPTGYHYTQCWNKMPKNPAGDDYPFSANETFLTYQAAQVANYPTPSLCSSWYIPSILEWRYAWDNYSTLDTKLTAVSGTKTGFPLSDKNGYWSSNPRNESALWQFTGKKAGWGNLLYARGGKDTSKYRWMLAF